MDAIDSYNRLGNFCTNPPALNGWLKQTQINFTTLPNISYLYYDISQYALYFQIGLTSSATPSSGHNALLIVLAFDQNNHTSPTIYCGYPSTEASSTASGFVESKYLPVDCTSINLSTTFGSSCP
jgi:hypothetical protein